MNYVIGESTAARLKEILARVEGDGGGQAGAAGTRRVCFVRVTSGTPDADGFYECVPTNYLTDDEDEWEDFDAALVIGANGEALAERRYLAVRAGDAEDGDAVFVTFCCEQGAVTVQQVERFFGSGSISSSGATLYAAGTCDVGWIQNTAGDTVNAGPIGTPAGWTKIASGFHHTTKYSWWLGYRYHYDDGAAASTWTTSGDFGPIEGAIVNVSLCGAPGNYSFNSGTGSPVTATGVTVKAPQALVLVFVQAPPSRSPTAYPAGLTELSAISNSLFLAQGSFAEGTMADQLIALAGSAEWGAALIALAPGIPFEELTEADWGTWS